MSDDFPAAHSMDSCWFAVDRDGQRRRHGHRDEQDDGAHSHLRLDAHDHAVGVAGGHGAVVGDAERVANAVVLGRQAHGALLQRREERPVLGPQSPMGNLAVPPGSGQRSPVPDDADHARHDQDHGTGRGDHG